MSTLEFNETLIHMESHLTAFARGFTRNDEDAKDLTQETMMKAIIHREYYVPQTNFKAWVFTIMRNIFINQYRRKKKSGTIFDHNKDLSLLTNTGSERSNPLNELLGKEINNQIGKLGDEYKVPFHMHIDGYKYKEIADQLDIPIGTVKSRIFVSRQKLMDLLPGYQTKGN